MYRNDSDPILKKFNKKAYKHALSMVESSGGLALENKASSAAGNYHFLYDLIKHDPDMSGVSKREFINRPELQEKIMEKALSGSLEGYSAYGEKYANKLRNEFGSDYNTSEIAAMVHFLGPGNTRKYLSDPENFQVPGKTNATVSQYLDRFNDGYNKYMMDNPSPFQRPTLHTSPKQLNENKLMQPKDNIAFSQRSLANMVPTNNFRKGGSVDPTDPPADNNEYVNAGSNEYDQAEYEGTFANKDNQLDEVLLYSGVDYEKYPYYNDLTKEERKLFNNDGPIGAGIRRKAYTKKGLADDARDMATGMIAGTPAAIIQAPQSALIEGIEAARGNEASFSGVFDPYAQRVPSDTFLKDAPLGFQIAGDLLIDPSAILGLPSAIKSALKLATNPNQVMKIIKSVPELAKNITKSVKNFDLDAANTARKLNPFEFKTSKNKIYRQVGEEGYENALREKKVFAKGQKEFLENNPNFDYAKERERHLNKTGFNLEKPSVAPFFKKDDLFFPRSFKKGRGKTRDSSADYLFEGDIPGDESLLPRYRDKYDDMFNEAGTGVLKPEYNDLSNFNVYKKNRLRGYKKIRSATPFKSEINWGKWNKEIPDNKPLMREYDAIEREAKANGTWMKNGDGSEFRGSPEQFVQQNSKNFKKAFPNIVVGENGNIQINYHGSPNKFTEFDQAKFYSGQYGKGVYTSPNKEKILKSYANPDGKRRVNKIREITGGKGEGANLYELYYNSKNPKSFDDSFDIPYDIKNYGKTLEDFPTRSQLKEEYKDAIKENPWIKTDQDFDNFMSDIMKITPREKAKLVLPDNDFLKIIDSPLKEQVAPFSNIPKSAVGNNGMFDMSNPNIYKAVVPAAGVGAAMSSQGNEFNKGGHMNSSQADVSSMLTLFENGGTHEENSLGGIAQGMGPNGKVNLVEQGETKWIDPRPKKKKKEPYVFSNAFDMDGNYIGEGFEKVNLFKKGGMLKRADGSYSKRGLWDNIRANRGSGKKPTSAMLKQERKINKKYDGGILNDPTDPPGTDPIGTAWGVINDNQENYVKGLPEYKEKSLKNSSYTRDDYVKDFSNNIGNLYNYSTPLKDYKGAVTVGDKNCINGVTCGLRDNTGLFQNKTYQGNLKFNDDLLENGFITLDKNDYTKEGKVNLEKGDLIRFEMDPGTYSRSHANAPTNPAPGQTYTSHTAMYGGVETEEGPNKGKHIYINNSGKRDFKKSYLTDSELKTKLGPSWKYTDAKISRYNPGNASLEINEKNKENKILSGDNKYASQYDNTPLNINIKDVRYANSLENYSPSQDRTSVSQIKKISNIFSNNYSFLGKVSNLPPNVLEKMIHSQIGIAGQESEYGNSAKFYRKSVIPDSVTNSLKTSAKTLGDHWDTLVGNKKKLWTDDMWKDPAVKKRFNNDKGDFLRATKSSQISGKGISTQVSKGVFQQKELSKRGRALGLNLDKSTHGPLASVALQIDNYHKLKKAYPDLNENQLIDLSILAHNQPSKAFNKMFVDYYLPKNDIDYVNKVKGYRNRFVEGYGSGESSLSKMMKEENEALFRRRYGKMPDFSNLKAVDKETKTNKLKKGGDLGCSSCNSKESFLDSIFKL